MRSLLPWWRHAGLAGLVVGLLAAPGLEPPAGWLPVGLVVGGALGFLRLQLGPRPGAPGQLAWVAAVAAAATFAGLGIGDARLDAIDAAAADGGPGSAAAVRGFVVAAPKRSAGELRTMVETPAGRLLVVTNGDQLELSTGTYLRARGVLAAPETWREGELRRLGARLELHAEHVTVLGRRRSGLTGAVDRARTRAERGLSAGLDDRESALARGFVLGQDDRVDARTREQFKRSGLAHLLSCYEVDITCSARARARKGLEGSLTWERHVPVCGRGLVPATGVYRCTSSTAEVTHAVRLCIGFAPRRSYKKGGERTHDLWYGWCERRTRRGGRSGIGPAL